METFKNARNSVFRVNKKTNHMQYEINKDTLLYSGLVSIKQLFESRDTMSLIQDN